MLREAPFRVLCPCCLFYGVSRVTFCSGCATTESTQALRLALSRSARSSSVRRSGAGAALQPSWVSPTGLSCFRPRRPSVAMSRFNAFVSCMVSRGSVMVVSASGVPLLPSPCTPGRAGGPPACRGRPPPVGLVAVVLPVWAACAWAEPRWGKLLVPVALVALAANSALQNPHLLNFFSQTVQKGVA